MAKSPIDGLYWDSHWPLSLKNMVDDVRASGKKGVPSPNSNSSDDSTHVVREWFSQPRASSDPTIEVITVNFRLPLSLGEISFEAQRVPVRIEMWYQDRLNNWRQVFDRQRIPVSVTLSASSQGSWYKHHAQVYPVVAKAVQLRCVRISDPLVGATPYTIGIRNTLLRRNVYDRTDGQQAFEDELDPIGNVVSKYIKDWDAPRAIDDQPLTFWRSAPQPDHQAVVSLYLNTCNPDGSPQLVDGIFIDPVYTGQNLNIYYSNDQTVGTRKMSVITLPPSTDDNTEWRVNQGRWDISSAPSGTCSYSFPIAVGPMVRQDVWVGLEWTPDFDPVSGPAQNPVLLSVTPTDPDPSQYWPKISYDVGAGEIQLELTNGTTTKIYQVALSPVLIPGDPLRIVVGWRYDPATVLVSVRTRNGTEIARLEDTDPDLPDLMTLDGQMGFSNFRGRFTSHIVKVEDFENQVEAYQANPSIYVSPDPVIPDASGQIPTTTLDNAIYAVDWTLQTHGSGGSHDSFYENKTWIPVWRNYTTTRGNLFLPQSISMRYLKMEFSNLTEEPYPVYDAGIKTTYKVFPVQVQYAVPSSKKTDVPALQLGTDVNLDRIKVPSVNWLNPTSVAQAVNAIFGSVIQPVAVNTGNALTFTTTLPATPSSSDTDTGRNEAASPYVYRRNPIDPQVLAAQIIAELGSEWIQNISYKGSDYSTQTKAGFESPPADLQNPSALPVQGQDWWLFPGGTLAMPAVVMSGLTSTAGGVEQGRKPSNISRLRFAITSIHRYDTKTVTRDAALAYFAGVREVRTLSKSYIDEQDPESFEFSVYDPNRWVFTNTRQLDSGPVTTAGKVYQIENPGFDLSTAFWDFTPAEDWSRDVTKGRWHWGSATVTADGEEKYGHSSVIDVVPGDNIKFSCWVMWEDLVATDGEPAIALGGTTYLDDEPVEDVVFGTVEYADWSEHPNSVQNAIWSLAVLGDPGGGTFNVEVEGDDADIDFDADETEIQTALEGLSSVGAGNVQVTLVGDHFEVEFINDLGSTLVDIFVVDGALLTGGTDPDAEGTLIQQASPDVPAWVRVEGTWEVPAGVDQVRIRPSVTEDATAGQVWFDGFVALSDDEVLATLYKEFITTSTFAKVRCDFRDSGLVRSDSMWARADPLATNIDNLELAYYVETIPDNSSSGMWGDTFGTWADDTIQWGAPNALVAISVDPNRIFDGRRVLKFARAAGAGEAGIKILQTTNFVADGLVRLGATFLKPLNNDNTITLRLRRLSDGVYIHEEVINKPPVGYWYTYQGQFIEIPDGADQAYQIELVTEGDSEDELLVNDCFCEIALIRYFIQLGGSGGFMHDVTSLRYADNSAQVVTTTPTNECSVQVAVLSPKSFAYGCIVSPMYLK